MSDIVLNSLEIQAGGGAEALHQRLSLWDKDNIGERIWERDATVWISDPELARNTPELSDRLGWLRLPEVMTAVVSEIDSFVDQVRASGFTRVVVLGMGGSSLIAEVWSKVFGVFQGFLPVTILDSTHPAAVSAVAADGDLEDTLFLVSSKSGGTLETLSFFNFFYHQVSLLKENPGVNFVALTDPGSRLEALALERSFYKIFSTPADVGGRYSALTRFGLLPAAFLGLPLETLLKRAQAMMQACGPEVKVYDNPALQLGAFVGEMARIGCDKLTLVLSPQLQPFAVWLEQLIAESTGKKGFGLVPVIVDGYEDLPSSGRAGGPAKDRLYLFMGLAGDKKAGFDQAWSRVQADQQPSVLITLNEKLDLAQEIWRFELATAAIGAVQGLNPFDQPDVEAAKIEARQAMSAWQQSGALPDLESLVDDEHLRICGSDHFKGIADLKKGCSRFIDLVSPGDYIALLVYLPLTRPLKLALQRFQKKLQKLSQVPVTIGYGPRFLHSTGQLHKGDGNHGLFLQISGALEEDLSLPGSDYSFATLIAAQAQGDYLALVNSGRRILALDLKGAVIEEVLGCLNGNE